MDIVFYTRGLEFDGGSLGEGSLGGSETAVICMARELAACPSTPLGMNPSTALGVAKPGNRVRVFCPCPRPGEYDGVSYFDVAEFPRFAESEQCDVFVCSRFLEGLAAPVKAKVYVLWNHDVLLEEAAPIIHSLMYRIDALFCLSEFQKEQYRSLLDIPAERFVVTRNGVDLGMVQLSEGEAVTNSPSPYPSPIKGEGISERGIFASEQMQSSGRVHGSTSLTIRRERNRLIYTSRPERGLKVLLDMWPRLKEKRPELTLGVAWYENPGADEHLGSQISDLRFQMERLEGVEFLGSLSKTELYREMARARVWVYPTAFPEISCISAIEAAGCGTPAVASRYCALKETVVDGETGLLIPGKPGSEEYARRFEEAMFSLLEDDVLWERMSEAGRKRVAERYQWRTIAGEWNAWLRASLRVKSRGSRVEGRQKISDIKFQISDREIGQTVSCCMIVKNGEGTLHRCLKSVRPWVEELIVCDTGSADSSREVAKQYADVVREIPWEEDFGEARNRSIEGAKGDWILWIDADEYLVGGEHLGKYLRDNMYNGYVIRQHHQALDAEFKPDVPVRLFRNGRGVKFYGVIHEHLEEALNQGIQPAVILSDVHIVHDGYITEKVRRERFLRNLPLLMKDREKYPQRRLGLVFLERDYIHLARYEMEKTGGRLTERAARFLEKAAAIHRENFADTANPLHVYSFPLYQTALALLDAGVEVAWYLGPAEVKDGGIRKTRFTSEEELRGVLEAQMRGMFTQPKGAFNFE